MIIVGSPNDYKYLAHNCDRRCVDGEWCIFADGTDHSNCPIDNEDNFIIVVKDSKHEGLVVE